MTDNLVPPEELSPDELAEHIRWVLQDVKPEKLVQVNADTLRILVERGDRPQDAMTTRGSRIPSTLTEMPPIAAYNLGWHEGRKNLRRPDRRVPSEENTASLAEEPIELRLMRAWLNGFREGAERASHGETWDRR